MSAAHDGSPHVASTGEEKLVKKLIISSALACFSAVGQTSNPVVQWNRELLAIVRTPGAQPATIHSTWDMAILHAAIYDAVNSIAGGHTAYKVLLPNVPAGASEDAAATTAGHEVLVNLYPSFQTRLDAFEQQLLSAIPDSTAKTNGAQVGVSVADQILLLRANDGSANGANPALPQYVSTGLPGDYQSTPPNTPKAQFFHWSEVTPFVLPMANQFRPGPPPALTSSQYTTVFNEIESIGMALSTAATMEQKIIGVFWNGSIQDYWQEIVQTTTVAKSLNTEETARLFAMVNIALADSVIAFYDAKYVYNFWRPVTAIRVADTDGNPGTIASPAWLPETTTTAADPSYPGAHATISSAAATVLAAFTGSDQFTFAVTSEVFAGVARPFTSFSGAAQEASLSRIYAGQHFRSDEDAGTQLGTSVAQLVVTNLLQ